uniref:Uncharacterized protein n=1 Tax=Anguilla anguilla TaxID=7936 RepID=A0A0E9Q4M8_ANGAN
MLQILILHHIITYTNSFRA